MIAASASPSHGGPRRDRLTDASSVSALRSIPYGEGEAKILDSVSTLDALQLDWPLQLRVALRVRRLSGLLIPHVWKRVSAIDQDLAGDAWRSSDCMMRHWNLTRHHILRDVRQATPSYTKSFLSTLQQILQRVDEVLGYPEMRLLAGTQQTIATPGQVLNAHLSKPQSVVAHRERKLHANFTHYISERVALHDGIELLTKLCRKVASNRRLMDADLPVQRLVCGLPGLDIKDDDVRAKQGRVLLLSWLKSNGSHELKFNALPQSLLLWNDSKATLRITLQKYLMDELNMPNGNALVACMWAHRQEANVSQFVKEFAAWLPAAPVVSAGRQFVQDLTKSLHQRDRLRTTVEFLLAMELDESELHSIFEPLLGHEFELVIDPNKFTQACLDKLQASTPPSPRQRKPLAPADIVKQVWGNKKRRKLSDDSPADDDEFGGNDHTVTSDANDDYLIDETDDRILLL